MKNILAISVVILTSNVIGAEVPVAARTLERGTIIQIEDITWQDVQISSNDSSMSDATKIVGLELKRQRKAGEIFRASDLAPPTMIKRGQSVTLLVATGGLQLATSGKSLQDGAQGSIVRVQNNTTRRIIEGRVLDSNTVQVSPPQPFQALNQ
jgi:flagellar basal body P-ring formation protein FlgA